MAGPVDPSRRSPSAAVSTPATGSSAATSRPPEGVLRVIIAREFENQIPDAASRILTVIPESVRFNPTRDGKVSFTLLADRRVGGLFPGGQEFGDDVRFTGTYDLAKKTVTFQEQPPARPRSPVDTRGPSGSHDLC